MKEQLALRMRGQVTFAIFDSVNRIKRIWKQDNAIQALAKDIVARNLIQDPAAIVDTISLYLMGNLIFAKPLSSRSIITTAEVAFQCTFAPTDFNGSFDAARLTASGLGDFSIIGNLVGSKNSTESLLVTWNIQIV